MLTLALLLACSEKDSGPVDSDTGLIDSPIDSDDTAPPEYLRDPYCGGSDAADAPPLGGWVALTFDDGPDLEDTPAIVAVLRQYEVPATFFVLGERAEDPDAWALLQDLNSDPLFLIGNHSYSHPALWDASWEGFVDEVERTDSILQSLGIAPRFFRFPYGASTCEQADDLAERGYTMAGWHVDTWDWCYGNVGVEGVCEHSYAAAVPLEYETDMIGFTLEQLRAFDGGVVLMHDIHAWTAESLEALILAIIDEGFSFTNLDDATVFPGFNGGERADLLWPGEPCSLTDDTCWQAQYGAWCEASGGPDEGICVLGCQGYCFERDGASGLFCADVGSSDGACLPVPGAINADCEALPGTTSDFAQAFSAGVAQVCWPEAW